MSTPEPAPAPVQIVINVQLSPDGSPTVQHVPKGDPHADPPEASKPQQHLDSLSVEKLLALCRVVRPADLVDLYDAERIRAVCRAALSAPRHNLGGWVAAALKKGWKV